MNTRHSANISLNCRRISRPVAVEATSASHNWRFPDGGLAAQEAPEKLLAMLDDAIRKRKAVAESKGASTDVLEVRAEVLKACDAAAEKPSGVFTLTVPPGGGKTPLPLN